MPKRENEWYLNDKESNLRYCVVCKRFFTLREWKGGHPHGKHYINPKEKNNRQDVDVDKLIASFQTSTKKSSEPYNAEKSNISPPKTPQFKDKKGNKTGRGNSIPNWAAALILISSISIFGVGVSFYIGSNIPLWLLLGFSAIYSIQKWLSYYTRKYKIVGKIYRLILNLSVLSLFGLLVWSGVSLFTQQFMQNSIIGSLLFLAELAIFAWLWRVVVKNSWRKPSMKLTVFSLICLFLIFSFAGVQPMASYKDKVISSASGYFNEMKIKGEAKLEQIKAEQEENRIAEEKRQEQELEEQQVAEHKAIETQKEELQAKLVDMEHEVLLIVNLIRSDKGIQMLQWDDNLYTYSKSHSEEMAKVNDMFHTDMYQSYAENCWMGGGTGWEATDIVESWMSSPMHRTWLLCPSLKRAAVGIVYSDSSTFASWTFWRNETSESDWWYQYTPDNPPKWWY